MMHTTANMHLDSDTPVTYRSVGDALRFGESLNGVTLYLPPTGPGRMQVIARIRAALDEAEKG